MLNLRRSATLLLTALLGMLFHSAVEAADVYSESSVRAAYLYRFTGYIDWPPATAASQFIFAVLGDDEVADELGHFLSGRTVKNLPAQAKRIANINELGNAQVLYIGTTSGDALRSAIAQLQGRPVLLVTAQQNALDLGSIINFVNTGRRVRFEVSIAAATRARLKISSELLAVASDVQGARDTASKCGTDNKSTDSAIACAARGNTP